MSVKYDTYKIDSRTVIRGPVRSHEAYAYMDILFDGVTKAWVNVFLDNRCATIYRISTESEGQKPHTWYVEKLIRFMALKMYEKLGMRPKDLNLKILGKENVTLSINRFKKVTVIDLENYNPPQQ